MSKNVKSLGKFYLISDLPLFSSLSSSDKAFIADRAQISEYKRGDVIYEISAPKDFLYLIIQGTVELYLPEESAKGQKETPVQIMRKGDCLGIVSMLGSRPHSLSARSLSDTRVIRFDDRSLSQILSRVPSLGLAFSRSLSKRMKVIQGSDGKIVESTVIAVYSSDDEDFGSEYAADLCLQISKESARKAVVLRFNKKNKNFARSSLKVKEINSKSSEDLLNCLGTFLFNYHYIIMDLSPDNPDEVGLLLKEADSCHVLNLKETGLNYTQELLKNLKMDPKKIAPSFFQILPLGRSWGSEKRSEYVRQKAREITGMRIGLSLGGGAAFGLAQIGVLKVIEQEKIPVDIVSGTSIGSLIGALWANGLSASDMEKMTEEFDSLFKMMKLMDFSIFPKKGLVSGKNVRKFLSGFLGEQTFAELKRELRVVSCNINRREEIVISEGNVVEAVMASTAIPGLFNPIQKEDGRVLVDGGVVNPLPVSVLAKEGIQRIIAVNAMPSPDDVTKSNQQNQNLMDIFINSFYSLQYSLCKYAIQGSDVYISPILENSSWYEFYRAKDFIELGEKMGSEKISELKKLMKP
ncbi:MAG TPA: patatin-like phospholipase family protein [Leptospiraceae bacterium]|nr:patatin-like phospholipase family protein [Leptospiraceae bacterium]HNN04075.1 patatin-like phospholipase family protein [Leptospiraceae bacterium]